MTHELKTWPEYFQKVKSGEKTFEIRKGDRDFRVNDILILKEWQPTGFSSTYPKTVEGYYTGQEFKVTVTYVLEVKKDEPQLFGIASGMCVMSITPAPNT